MLSKPVTLYTPQNSNHRILLCLENIQNIEISLVNTLLYQSSKICWGIKYFSYKDETIFLLENGRPSDIIY